MARILNEEKSSIGGPYVFYTVYATEVEKSRTADSVQIRVQVDSHLQYSSSTLGRGYPLTGYIKLQNTDYSITLKNSDDSWSSTTVHSISKTITLTNLEASLTQLSNIKFRVVAKNSSESGTLPSTDCSNLSISIGHYIPSGVAYTMTEVNPILINAGVSNDLFIENLSIKQFQVNYTLHDNATIVNVGIANRTQLITSTSNPFNVDLSQKQMNKWINDDTKIPIIAYATDSFDTRGYSSDSNTPDLYSYITYTPITITNNTTNAKRVGQTSGQVAININGIMFNGIIGNIDQSNYKPTIKYKFWKYGDNEPSTYTNTIASSDIDVIDNTFVVTSLNIGSTTESATNYFGPNYAYRIKIYVEDNFTNYESNELQIQKGIANWSEYIDRVDFEKLTLRGIDTAYYPGGTINLGGIDSAELYVVNGYVTNAGRTLFFTLNLPKKLIGITTITPTSIKVEARGTSGYLNSISGFNEYVGASGYTVEAHQLNENDMMFRIDKTTAFSNLNNNTPVVLVGHFEFELS